MKKFKGFDFHRRRFIGLAIIIFAFVAIGHALRLVFGWELVIGGVVMPQMVSVFAVAFLAMMVIMGRYYYFVE